ncbi:MAG: VCBS repeat-containing protein [Pseudomonadota bacterium]
MTIRAPRRLARLWLIRARGAVQTAALVGLTAPWLASGAAQAAEGVVSAEYGGETTRYAHGVLGDAIEYGSLTVVTDRGRRLRIVLPEHSVFEDLAPRVVDLDGDGAAEVVVVESHRDLGGQLAVYGPEGKIAATPHIGRTNRWLAPIGAADFDGDGAMEIGYIDRPHLAKTLLLWRYEDRALTWVAALPGMTNHRIGEDFISGGIRDCAGPLEMVVAEANWSGTVAVRFTAGQLSRAELPYPATPSGFADALSCAP